MAVFDRLDRMTSRVADRTFARQFNCTPMTARPNGRPQPDPGRPPWDGAGIYEEAAVPLEVQVGNRTRSGHDLRTALSGASYELSIDIRRYPAAAAVQQGDVIAMDNREFQVREVCPDGLSRVVLQLSR